MKPNDFHVSKTKQKFTSTWHEIDPQNSNLDQKPAVRKVMGKECD